jgi:hypothetical protein
VRHTVGLVVDDGHGPHILVRLPNTGKMLITLEGCQSARGLRTGGSGWQRGFAAQVGARTELLFCSNTRPSR